MTNFAFSPLPSVPFWTLFVGKSSVTLKANERRVMSNRWSVIDHNHPLLLHITRVVSRFGKFYPGTRDMQDQRCLKCSFWPLGVTKSDLHGLLRNQRTSWLTGVFLVLTGDRGECRPGDQPAVLPQTEEYPSIATAHLSYLQRHLQRRLVPSLTRRLSEVDGDQVRLRRRRMRRLHGHGVTLPTDHQDHRVSFGDKLREQIWSGPQR